MKNRKVDLITVGIWLALLLALVGSLRHVAWTFSTLENGNLGAGYVQAVAVDLGLVALALGIQQRRRQRRGTLVLWIGVGLFSAISVYANLLYGLVHQQNVLAGQLADMRPVLMSAVLPMLVLYLSEIAGGDLTYSIRQREREDRRRARSVSKIEEKDALVVSAKQARAALAKQREHSKQEVLNAMLDIWRTRPDMPVSKVARRVGRSRSTIYTYLAELEQAGQISRDDGIVEVIEISK